MARDGILVQHIVATADSFEAGRTGDSMAAALFALTPGRAGVGVSFSEPGARQIFGVVHIETPGGSWDSPWILLEAVQGLDMASWSKQTAFSNASQDVLYAVTQLVAGRQPVPEGVITSRSQIENARQQLLKVDRRLLERFDGALARAREGGPDAMSQGANSLQETIDHLLRNLAPNAECLAWCRLHFAEGILDDDRLTRPARVRYLFAKSGKDPTASLRMTAAVQELTGAIQKLKHGNQFTDPSRIDELAYLASSWINGLLS